MLSKLRNRDPGRSGVGAEGTELLPHQNPEPFHGRYRKVLIDIKLSPLFTDGETKAQDEGITQGPE